MTVTNTKSATEHVSTGVETSWVYTFDAQETGQIKVYVIDEYNVKTDVTASVTVDIATQTVTYGPITSGYKLRIERSTTPTQEVDLSSQGPLLPEVLEDALDKLTYISQETKNIVSDFENAVAEDIKYVGDWATSTTYLTNQAVTRYGNLYVCLQAHTSDASNGPVDLASNAYWSLVARRGDQGYSIVWRGAWGVGNTYAELEAVEHNGSSYICIADHSSTSADEPGVGTSWTSYWDLMAKKGLDGTGDLTGPGSAVAGNFASFADTTGKLVADSGYGAADFIENVSAAVQPTHLDTAGAYTVGSLEAAAITRGGSTIWGDDNFAARIAALTANASPAGTESVACDDGQRVTIQDIAGLASADPDFVSGQTTFGNSGKTSVAHGLGANPSRIAAYLVATATTTTNGYPQGAVVELGHDSYYDVSVWADSANVYLTTYNSPRIPSSSGSSYDTLCYATEWAVVFMAWV